MRGLNRSHRALSALVIFFMAILLLVPVAGAANVSSTLPYALQPTKNIVVNPDISKIIGNSYNVTVTVNQTSIAAGGHATVTAKVTWAANGTPATGVPVEFTCSPATGTFDPAASTTSSVAISGRVNKGEAKADFTSNAPGSYTITAQAYKTFLSPGNPGNVKDDSGTKSLVVSAAPVTQTPTPEPGTPTPPPVVVTPGTDASILADYGIYIAIGAVLLLILAAVALFLWLKSSLQVVPKKTKVPADGSSKVPVRVQFVNGLGMVKTMSRDTDVEFETTAGTIKNTVIPQGKDHVDADLVSSKEFGPVTLTTRARGMTTVTKLDFTVEQGSLDITAQPGTIPADGASSAAVTVMIMDDKGNVVAPLEDKTITLKSTIGNIAPTLQMPARTQSASTNITAGEASGTAVIVATLGNMHGEGKVIFKGMPKRFCMHCGTPMSLEASQCPKCGRTPPSGTDVKQCSACSTVIPEAARFCHHCGARQPDKQ